MEYFTELKVLNDARFGLAVHLFNQQHWYMAHDAFEELWHESHGEVRSLLQAVIQISVAEYHLENGNLRGSTLLMAEGLNHLQTSESVDLGFDLPRLRSLVTQRLHALQSGSSLASLPLPVLACDLGNA